MEDEKRVDKELEELEKNIKAVSALEIIHYDANWMRVHFYLTNTCIPLLIITQAKYVNSALKQEIKDLDNAQEQVMLSDSW